MNFAKFQKKFKLMEKRIRTHGKENKRLPPAPPLPTPIHKTSMTPMIRNISNGQHGCLALLPPSSCKPAH